MGLEQACRIVRLDDECDKLTLKRSMRASLCGVVFVSCIVNHLTSLDSRWVKSVDNP